MQYLIDANVDKLYTSRKSAVEAVRRKARRYPRSVVTLTIVRGPREVSEEYYAWLDGRLHQVAAPV